MFAFKEEQLRLMSKRKVIQLMSVFLYAEMYADCEACI